MAYLTESQARELAQRILSFSKADEARVNVASGRETNTRFAVNQITTSGETDNVSITITSAFGTKVGSASTNATDDASLRRTVETSEAIARLAPDDPEYIGLLEPQTYPPQANRWFEPTANLDAERRAAAVRAVTERSVAGGHTSTGFIPQYATSQAVANSRGLFAYSRQTGVAFSTTVRTADRTGSGWAGTSQHDWSRVDPDALAEKAVRKAEMSRNPRRVDPGPWTVILEPEAVGSLVGFLFQAMSARAADEQRSAFARPGGGTLIGEKIVDERVTLLSDPNDPEVLTSPFDNEGLPNRRMVWVENGVLANLQYDRYWARQQEVAPSGFAAGSYRMSGGEATVEEMIATTARGLLVTRSWYMRSVDQRTILFTGLTRDGTFLVENGRITGAVQNLRWNESPLRILNNIEMMGRPERVLRSEDSSVSQAVIVPALKLRNFNFTSVSDAV